MPFQNTARRIISSDPAKTIATSGAVKGYSSEMLKALAAEDFTAYDTMVEALREAGVEDSTIKGKISDTYRDQYKDAYRKGDFVRMMEIENLLDITGFDFSTSSWQKQVDNEKK